MLAVWRKSNFFYSLIVCRWFSNICSSYQTKACRLLCELNSIYVRVIDNQGEMFECSSLFDGSSSWRRFGFEVRRKSDPTPSSQVASFSSSPRFLVTCLAGPDPSRAVLVFEPFLALGRLATPPQCKQTKTKREWALRTRRRVFLTAFLVNTVYTLDTLAAVPCP